MGFKSNLFNSTNNAKCHTQNEKEYSCFICDYKSFEKGLPLLVCETTISNICLGEKLQEILSDKFTLLVSPNDTICWDCAMCINRVDRYEHKIDILKDHIISTILAKYKHEVEIPRDAFNLQNKAEEEEELEKQPEIIKVEDVKPVVPQITPVPENSTQRRTRGRPPGRKTGRKAQKTNQKPKKKYLCRFCGYSYSNECSMLSHMLQKHPPKFLCHICDSPFSNKSSYDAHMSMHLNNRPAHFKCKICGFQSDSNNKANEEHICSEKIKVTACSSCQKECYVSPRLVVTGDSFKCNNCAAKAKEDLGNKSSVPVKIGKKAKESIEHPIKPFNSSSQPPPATNTAHLPPPSPPLSLLSTGLASSPAHCPSLLSFPPTSPIPPAPAFPIPPPSASPLPGPPASSPLPAPPTSPLPAIASPPPLPANSPHLLVSPPPPLPVSSPPPPLAGSPPPLAGSPPPLPVSPPPPPAVSPPPPPAVSPPPPPAVSPPPLPVSPPPLPTSPPPVSPPLPTSPPPASPLPPTSSLPESNQHQMQDLPKNQIEEKIDEYSNKPEIEESNPNEPSNKNPGVCLENVINGGEIKSIREEKHSSHECDLSNFSRSNNENELLDSKNDCAISSSDEFKRHLPPVNGLLGANFSDNENYVCNEVILESIDSDQNPSGTRKGILTLQNSYEKQFIGDAVMLPNQSQEPSNKNQTEGCREVVPAFIRCPTCVEEIDLKNVSTHQCFLETQVVEYLEQENIPRSTESEAVAYSAAVPLCIETQQGANYLTTVTMDSSDTTIVNAIEIVSSIESDLLTEEKKSTYPPISKLKCKTCDQEFPSTNSLRHHWQVTGHSWEVDTDYLEFNKIMDKVSNTETTFKVLKQKFDMKAVVPTTEVKVETPESPSVKNMIVRVNSLPQCTKCYVTFPTEETLKEHSTLNCLTCVTCSITFLNHKLLRRHYTCTGHSTRVFLDKKQQTVATDTTQTRPAANGHQCHVCRKKCNSRFLLGKHLAGHFRGTTRTACQFCLQELDKSEIQQHVLEMHGARLYKCEHCERTFMSSKFRDSHQAKHQIQQRDDEMQCRPCRIKFTSHRAFTLHNETFHREMSCRICGKYISDLYSLKRHENRHYYNKGLECNLCMKTFRNKISLDAHSKTHTGEFKFLCDICNRGFMGRPALEEHRIVHINKTYTCGRCGTKCSSRIAYWMHSKMHDCPYSCSVCGRMYRDTSLLAVHRRKHWRVRPYQCPHCPRTFSVPATLRRHLTVHTRAYPHRCALCRRGFLTRYAFHKHLDTSHNIQQSSVRKMGGIPYRPKAPSLPLSATDEDLFQAADTLIADESVMFVDYGNRSSDDMSLEQMPTNEVVVETTELFDELLN